MPVWGRVAEGRAMGPPRPRPHQHATLLIHRQAFGIDQVVLERFERLRIKLELEREDAMG